jgi:regulator of protease activity HflC (stomatin/prohibitin superfamily)
MITAIVTKIVQNGRGLTDVNSQRVVCKSHGRMAVDVVVLIGSSEEKQDLSLSEKPKSLLVQGVHPEL